MSLLSPPLLYLVAALACPFLASRWRALLLLGVPVAALMSLLSYDFGLHETVRVVGFELTFVRVDGLSRIFAIIFSIAAFLSGLYAWHVRDTVQQVATLGYAGSAMGGVLAGDLITLFLWWEGTAIASVFLIWARRTPAATATGMRYLIVQVLSGVLLLVGLLLHYHDTGSVAFDHLGLDSPGTLLIFLSFGIKCAFPLLHNWLQDAYPAATVTGTVVLSAFTTKMAVYALARGYAGTEILVWIGAIMTLFPIFFAEIENDLRRVLAYSLNNQLGFMVVGVGIGTEMALNGTAAHAFAHILYKALLFMSVGAVLYRTGTSKASELGGLYRTMPVTAACCLVGAASISAFPLFSGFVSKSLILSAASDSGYYLVWFALLVASAGVLSHSGIKVPYFAFFAEDSGKRPAEAPRAHARRDDRHGDPVRRDRHVSRCAVRPPAVRRRVPPLHLGARAHADAAAVLRAARFRVPHALGAAPARGARGEPRQRRGVPQVHSVGAAGTRRGHRARRSGRAGPAARAAGGRRRRGGEGIATRRGAGARLERRQHDARRHDHHGHGARGEPFLTDPASRTGCCSRPSRLHCRSARRGHEQ